MRQPFEAGSYPALTHPSTTFHRTPKMSLHSPQTFIHDPSAATFAVSKSDYLRLHPSSPTLLATSALVLHRSRVLLLQRASTDSNPNKWEPPGGAVDDDDPSILYAVARELREETGLSTIRIGGLVETPQLFNRANGEGVVRFCFRVAVEDADDDGKKGEEGEQEKGVEVRLDEREHQRYVWATEEEVREGRVAGVEIVFVGEEVRRTVLAAFGHVWEG